MRIPIRFLMSRDDFYHQRGYWVVIHALREAGMEVIHGGIQIPREIVATAIQEDVDIIGYRIMQGSPKVLVPSLFEKMREGGIDNIPVVIGGIIPEKDELLIKHLGIRGVFHPFTPLETIVKDIQNIIEDLSTVKPLS
ncbi:MAG: cobalamin-dependent protein [Spirochaetota bacterium]|nr:cobalamin-dependent protein [Spirochaetota bacterium]